MPITASKEITPPQALDAEQEVLGAMLKDSEAVNTAVEMLMPMDFYSNKHQIIFEAMTSLYNQSEPIDITILSNKLLADGHLEKIGGRLYLVQLTEVVISTSNIQSHCEIVKNKSLLRRTIQVSSEVIKSCYSQEQPISDILAQAESAIYGVSDRHFGQGLTPVSADMPDLLQYISDRAEGKHEEKRVKTGFYDLDRLVSLENGELIIVAARPSIGKSAFALNIAEYVALNQKKVVSINSVEMSKQQLEIRLLSSVSGVRNYLLRYPNQELNKYWDKITHAQAKLFQNDYIFIDDSTSLTPMILKSKLKRLKSQHGLSLAIVDYLQLMHSGERTTNSVDEISLISRQLMGVAKDLDIPLIVLSQFSRAPEHANDNTPKLHHLRGSGSLEQDANTVIFVHRKDKEATDAKIIVAKQRAGATGSVDLYFDKEITKFKNKTREEMPF